MLTTLSRVHGHISRQKPTKLSPAQKYCCYLAFPCLFVTTTCCHPPERAELCQLETVFCVCTVIQDATMGHGMLQQHTAARGRGRDPSWWATLNLKQQVSPLVAYPTVLKWKCQAVTPMPLIFLQV